EAPTGRAEAVSAVGRRYGVVAPGSESGDCVVAVSVNDSGCRSRPGRHHGQAREGEPIVPGNVTVDIECLQNPREPGSLIGAQVIESLAGEYEGIEGLGRGDRIVASVVQRPEGIVAVRIRIDGRRG